jgi:O-antigen/teichoic acid export membrane protein
MAAVAYYVTPYETVTKLWFIPGAMAGVLFPVFSTISRQEPERAAFFFGHGVKSVFLVLFPITLLIVLLGHEGLDLWMGKEFADHSTRVLQWLTMGVFANSLAQIPYAFIQGLGRPDVTAKLHLLELPFYLIALGWLMGVYGIEGAGMVWFGRALLDAILLFWMARRLRPETADFIGRMAWLSAAGLLILSVPLLPISSLVNRVFFLFMLLGFPLVAWLFIPVPEKSRRNQ